MSEVSPFCFTSVCGLCYGFDLTRNLFSCLVRRGVDMGLLDPGFWPKKKITIKKIKLRLDKQFN